MRPTTLEEALAWLAKREGDLRFTDDAVWVVDGALIGYPVLYCEAGDIPAAIVEAVGQVWELVNGEGSD